ncbi:MAG: acyl esterase [Microbacterium sp.]|uniref:ECF transporter S component n=1 Tax=Microbacterium sp. TaxID=51671 RepID=UPI00261ED4CC|nr:ECF transporter S component [Microbacterium sp.]MDF2561405.1 acyl esterase [Microbacterium sp.]
MARTPLLSTRVLLVCAAIGVATGILAGIAGWVTPVLLASPLLFLYGLVLGSHVLPGIIAQEVLRLPLVALITHVFAALIASAFNPAWALRFIGTALLFGLIQEGVAALTRYRAWGPWRFFLSAGVIGVVVAVVVFFAAHLSVMPVWAQILYLAISVLGPVAWTAVGLAVGSALRRAGVARR